jgi:outer membrane protein assembly complex protein YaeT
MWGSRWLRWFAIAAGVLVLATVALVAILQSKPVRDRAMAFVAARAAGAGLLLRADQFDYNLLALSFRATGVSLATSNTPATPLLTAAELDASLSWHTLLGRVQVERVRLVSPHFMFRRDAQGRANWSLPDTGTKSSGIDAVRIDHLSVTNAIVEWIDDSSSSSARADLSADLSRAHDATTGTVLFARPVEVHARNRTTSLAIDGTAVAWNDRDLSVQGVSVRAPEGSVKLEGRVERLLSEPHIDARTEADLNLAALSPWVSPDTTLHGSLRAVLHVTDRGAELTALEGRVAAGDIRGRGSIGFDGAGAASVAWNGIDVDALLRDLLADSHGPSLTSRASGTLDARFRSDGGDRLQLTASTRLTAYRPPKQNAAVPLDGTITVAIQNGRWRLDIPDVGAVGVHAASSLGGRVDWNAVANSSMEGTLRVRTDADTDFSAAAAAAGAGKLPQIRGDAAGEFAVRGTVAAPVIDGTAHAAVQYESLPPIRASAHASATAMELQLDDVDARMPGISVQGGLHWSFAGDRLDGAMDTRVAVSDLPHVASFDARSLGASGTIEAKTTISGRPAAPVAVTHVTGVHVAAAGQSVDRLAIDVRLDGANVTIDALTAESGAGRVEAAGAFNTASGTYAARATVTDMPVAPLSVSAGDPPIPISGRVSATFDGTGTWNDPRGRGHATIADAAWDGSDLGTIDADLGLKQRAIAVGFAAKTLALDGRATIGLDADGPLSASANWTPNDLGAIAARLAPSLSLAGSAVASTEWRATRAHPADGEGWLRLDRFDATIDGHPVELVEPGRIDVAQRDLRVAPITIRSGQSRATIEGELRPGDRASRILLTLTGSLGDVVAGAEGAVRAGVALRGTDAEPEISATASIANGRVPVDASHAVEGVEAGLRYDAGVVRLERASATFEGAVATATALVPSAVYLERLPAWLRTYVPAASGAATLDADIRSVTAAVITPFVGPGTLDEVRAAAEARVALEADALSIDRLRGSVTLQTGEFAAAGLALQQTSPTRLTIGNGRATIDSFRWAGRDQQIVLEGGLSLDKEPAVDMIATAGVDLRLIGALVPSVRTGGRADLRVRIAGPLREPLVDGFVTLASAEARLAEPRTVVDDINGTITFAGDAIVFERISGSVNGGYLEVGGTLRHRGLEAASGAVTVQVDGAAFDLASLRVETNALLSWTIVGAESSLNGTVTVLRGAYRDPIPIGRIVAAARTSAAAMPSAATLVDRTRLDVHVVTDEDLIVDNNVARLAVRGDVRAIGTVGQPGLTGRFTLADGGVVYFNGTRYQIEEGSSIDFSNTSRIEPDLDVKAVARVQGNEITLTLTGTPSTLQTKLDADNPQLSESDKVSLLLLGRTASTGEDDSRASQDVLGLVAGGFLDAAGRAVGLDTARVERGTPDVRFDAGLVASETDPGARFTFGKTIGRWDVIFSQSLEKSGGLTWIVGYRPGAGIDLRVVSLDNYDRVYSFGHDITLGASPRRPSPPRREVPRVRAIAVAGAGGDEPEVRQLLKLRAGDRFDFFEWEDDRDRVERFYAERGHLEARLKARRTAVPDDPAGLDLAYDIRPGRTTTVVTTGYVLSKRATQQLQQAWARSVADEFLIDEAAQIVRNDLADAGFLLPSVTATIDAGERQKTLHVRVDRGVRASARQIEIIGNSAEPRTRLLDVLNDAPADAVWINPDRARDALAAFYRAEGYLDCAVRVDPIEMKGTTAVRTIRIDEGSAYLVQGVHVEGIHALDASATRVAGLSAGDRYTDAELQAAQLALENQYRARGFNRVSIAARARSAGPGVVDVDIQVDEGPQQRLRAITINGVSRTKPELISRALQLNIGDPVDLAAWNEARRRIYATGVFRGVDLQREPMESETSTGDEPVRAVVTVEEWPPARLRYGVEVTDQSQTVGAVAVNLPNDGSSGRTFGVGVAASLDARSLFGTALTAGVSGRYTSNIKAARVYATSPVFMGRPITTNFFVERSAETVGTTTDSSSPVFETQKSDFTIEQRIRITTGTTLSYLFTVERNHTREANPNPFDPLPFDVTVTTGNLGSSLVIDRRNDLNNASRGWFHASTFEYSPGGFASDVKFVRYFVQQFLYRPVGPVVLAGAARLGLANAFEATLTPDRRFFAGGGNSVRGYEQDALSPGFLEGAAVGGNALMVFNGEVRFPVFRFIRGIGFVDAGRAFDHVSDLSFGALSASGGGGLRLETPFALLRVDAGVPFDSAYGPRRVRWFFSIGQLF